MQPLIVLLVITAAVVLPRVAYYALWRAVDRPYWRYASTILFTVVAATFLVFVGTTAKTERDRRAFWIIATVAAISIPLGIARTSRQKTRRTGLADWGASHGFVCVSQQTTPADETLPDALLQLPLFLRAIWPSTHLILEQAGEHGKERTLIVDCEWRVKPVWYSTRTYPRYATIFAFHKPGLNLPAFELQPAGYRVNSREGPADCIEIDLPVQQPFSTHYRLRAPDVDRVAPLFRADVAAAMDRQPGWCVEAYDDWLTVYYFRRAESFWTLQSAGLRQLGSEDIDSYLSAAVHQFRTVMITYS